MNDFFKFYSGSLSGTIIVIIIFLFITVVRLHGKQHGKCIWLHKGVNRGAG